MAAGAIAVTLEVARELERLRIPYCVGGSLASSLHGIPRSTEDADVVVALTADRLMPLVEALEGRFYVDAKLAREAVDNQSCFNVIHLETMFKVDLFVAGDDPVVRLELARRQEFVLSGGETLAVASAEDIVLQKLLWFERGRGVSERQWRDALGVLEVNRGRLDEGYLEAQAQELGIGELLRRLRAAAG